jgi:hypothetical protein
MLSIKRLFAVFSLLALFGGAALAAVPSVEAVQDAVRKGDYAQAQSMMQEVVTARPGSARAHYVYAEILAHNRRFDEAVSQLAQARQIAPALGFADAAKVQGLAQLLERERAAERSRPLEPAVTSAAPAVRRVAAEPASQSSSGWVWILALGGAVAIGWALLSRRRPAPAAMTPAVYSPGVGAAPMGVQPASAGPGLLGVGLAAAGGVAAGMLAEKLLHGDSGAGYGSSGSQHPGGLQPGMFDDQLAGNDAAAQELEQRPIDFGNGGDDWDAGGGGDAGGGDSW